MSMTQTTTRLSLAGVQIIVDTAIAAANEREMAFAIAVCNADGRLISFTEMDGAPFGAAQVAQDKAHTAAGWKMSTEAWWDFIKADEPLLHGVAAGINRFVMFGGGIPLMINGDCIGAIGVSGGHWSDDVAIAKAGMAAMVEP